MDPPKICILGAGFSGINAGIQLQKQLGITNFVIFEELENLGGTWFSNTYPGCACDVASHLYSYSFEPNPNWSQAYSTQPEILKYLENVANKYDLNKNIKFQHKVKKITWDEKLNKWRIVVLNKTTNMESEVIFNLIISGVGGLRVPHTPNEFLPFQARVHSAEWNADVKLEGKRVGVVGSGASAIQIIPAIADKVEKLITFQRRPAWVLPRMQFKIPEWLQWSFRTIPGLRQFYRSLIFLSNELTYPAFIQGSFLQKVAKTFGNRYLKQEFVDRPDLLEKVRPNYEMGCKRITPSNVYYSILKRPNVELVRSKITKVKEHSIVTEDGNEHEIDILICATGFKVQEFYSPLDIIVKDGINLMKLWKKEGPSAYMGICNTLTPNTFFLLGPNTGLGHNSIIFSIECQTNYVIKLIREFMRREASTVCVKESVETAYMNQILQDLKPTVWATSCASWYADHRGVITALSPYSLITAWRQMRTLNTDDFQFE